MMEDTSQWLLRYRRLVALGVHLLLFVLAQAGAFGLRFEFSIPAEYFPLAWLWLAVNVGIHLAVFAWSGMFAGLWRYTGARDLVALTRSTALSTLIFAAFIVLGGYRSYPRSILIIDFLLTMILVGGLRFGARSLWQLAQNVAERRNSDGSTRRRVLIVGAGNAGEMLVREMHKSQLSRYEAVGFVDDNPNKQGVSIHGVRVMGRLAQTVELVRREKIDEVVIAIPSAPGKEMRRIVDTVKPAEVPIRTMPGIDQLISGQVTLNQLRSVAIEDLLGRDPVSLDTESLKALLEGHVVLVTGAGGSIGAELCRQVARFAPKQVVLLERSEPALFEIHRELSSRHPELDVVPCIADICDAERVRALFARHRPTVVVHAAAHKHVPMMEWNPGEALKNNVGGTRVVADAAHEFSAEQFVMVSTDKAVNPTSIMGATKRVAELYVQALNQKSKTRFVAVRFGNVLGSAGSVIPIFKEQIAQGGPITVTHPDMRRYFMTIPEASQLVLQAATIGRGGEIFVLDMGEPVKIVDLARDLITLSGLAPDKDIEIRFTGLRPGEKLFEELSTADERAEKTRHPKIFIGKLPSRPLDQVAAQVATLLAGTNDVTTADVVTRIRAVVPELQREESPQAQVIALRQRG
jgi:FlaA1/EpsC-like NDP-sugar epimerase